MGGLQNGKKHVLQMHLLQIHVLQIHVLTNPPFTNPYFTNLPFTNPCLTNPIQSIFYNMPVGVYYSLPEGNVGSLERDYSLPEGDKTLEKGFRSRHGKDVQLHKALDRHGQ